MPNIAYGNSFRQSELNLDVVKADFDYEYPNGLDLKPGSKLHQDLVSRILRRARESSLMMMRRHPSWNNIDRVLTVYALSTNDDKEIDKITEMREDDPRKPLDIVFPYSFVIMETMLSYLTAAFFQDPVFRYEGYSPEDIKGALLMQYVIQKHCDVSKVLLNMHTMFRDSLSYGFGATAPYWLIEEGYRTIFREEGGRRSKFKQEEVLFEGNALSNIDPYSCLPDPNVSIHDVQKGEFFGYVELTNYMNLLSEEKTSDDLFNVKYLKLLNDKKTSIFSEDASAREEKQGGRPLRRAHSVTNEVDNINMFVKLIPKEWKLGDGEYPEKWLFTVSGDSIIIRAKPIGLNHNKYPVAISAPDFDGYSSTPLSRLEVLYGLQHVLDWLFNTHIVNVRKAINDMFVVDPYIINVNDLKTPKPGKIVRTRRPVWGKGVKDAVQQLAVQDITRANIADGAFIMQYMEKIGSADTAMQGQLRTSGPERLTGKEFEGTRAGAYSRMERVAKIIGIQAMRDIGYFFASHAQQLMSEEVYVKTVGQWPERLSKEYGNAERLKVTPYDILVRYDLLIRDGSIPGGNFSRIWIDMFKVLAEHPELQQEFDTVRIFKHIARNSGAKNVDEFVRVKTMSDEAVARGAERGDLVPLSGGQR